MKKSVYYLFIHPNTGMILVITIGATNDSDEKILEQYSPENTMGELKKKIDTASADGFHFSNWHVVDLPGSLKPVSAIFN